MFPEPATGRGAALARVRAQPGPFDDGAVEPVGLPFVGGSGEERAYRWRFTGRHVRPIDPPGFAATGAHVSIDGVSVLRLADDWTVRQVRLFFDSTELARQIRAAPRPGSAAEHAAVALQCLSPRGSCRLCRGWWAALPVRLALAVRRARAQRTVTAGTRPDSRPP